MHKIYIMDYDYNTSRKKMDLPEYGANFECERPHRNTAFQWFRRDGVLAWLPLPGQRISMG